MYKVKDNAEAQLQFGISSVATTLVLKEGQGDKFPGVPFLVVLNKRNSDWEITKSEKIEVTAKNWDQLTVKRGFEWTTPSDFSADDFVSLFVLARHIEDLQTEVAKKADQTDVQSVDQRTTSLEEKVATQEEKVGKLEEAGTPDHLGITGIVGEKYTMQDTLFLQKAPTLADSILPLNVWDTNTNKEQHIQRISSGVASNQLKLKMDKVLSPTSSVVVEVRKGIKVDVNEREAYWYGGWEVLATATLPYTKFSTEAQEITVDLNKSFQLPKGNLYSVVVIQQGGIVNANNYYRVYCDSTQWSEAFSAVAVNGTNRTRAKLMPYCVSDGFMNNIAAKSSSTEITIPQLETYLYNRNWADFVFEDENDLMLLFVAPTDMEIEAEITFRRNIWPQLGGLWNFYVNVNETRILEVYVSYWGNTGKKSNKIKVKKWDVISITKNANSFWASNPKVGIAMQNFYIRAFLTSISKQKTDEVIYAREQRAIGEVVKCTTFGRHIDGRRIDRNFFTSQLSSSVRTGNIPLGNAIWFMPFVAPDGKTYKIPIFWN